MTVFPVPTNLFARNWPKLPNPIRPILSCRFFSIFAFSCASESNGWAASIAQTLKLRLVRFFLSAFRLGLVLVFEESRFRKPVSPNEAKYQKDKMLDF